MWPAGDRKAAVASTAAVSGGRQAQSDFPIPKINFPLRSENAARSLLGAGKEVRVIRDIVDIPEPYAVQVIESEEVPPGMEVVREEGAPGVVRIITEKTAMQGGEEKGEEVARIELSAPKQKVVLKNSRPAAGESFDTSNMKISQTFMVEATAYTYTGNNTYSGEPPRYGLIAVDPKVIPLGSRLYVEGYGYAVAADTGGAIRGKTIDVFFPTLRQCQEWGRKKCKIFLLLVENIDN
jgi:3D (Asp-Asp-Asp) domain-containing protein